MQLNVLYLSLAGMAIVAAFFVAAVRASVNASPPSAEGTERYRAGLIWFFLIAGIAISVTSLWHWPHDVSTRDDAIAMNVSGVQWTWEIDRLSVPVGQTVIFNVHSQDVNHGMGIVDESGELLLQIQSMPGYVNRVRYVFNRPGTYQVVCLEYCGVAHHEMIDTINVTEEKS